MGNDEQESSMQETVVTLHGWVGNDVTLRKVNDSSVANFRLASTPRVKRKGKWQDGDTTWFTVTAWRALADNITDSVHKGDAVIVHGRLRSEIWQREDGQRSTTLVVEATLVGHDLCRGTSAFVRATRPERQDDDVADEVARLVHEGADVDDPRDSWGNPLTGDDADPEQDRFASSSLTGSSLTA
jgi:single-strand DNA-binding protein